MTAPLQYREWCTTDNNNDFIRQVAKPGIREACAEFREDDEFELMIDVGTKVMRVRGMTTEEAMVRALK